MKSNHSVDRRTFISVSLLAFGGGVLKFNLPQAGEKEQRTDPRGPADWVEKIRGQIPATKESVYFQTAGNAPSTVGTLEKIKQTLDYQNKGPADPRFGKALEQIEPDLRTHIAQAFGAHPDEVALTHSTTEGINIAIWSIDWKENDEVIISNQEHPANVVPWYNLRDRFGIAIREINLDTGTNLISEVQSKITPNTKMVSLSHVTRNTGRRLRTEESAELASLLRKKRIRYHLDGAQGPGQRARRFPGARLRLLQPVRPQMAARLQGHWGLPHPERHLRRNGIDLDRIPQPQYDDLRRKDGMETRCLALRIWNPGLGRLRRVRPRHPRNAKNRVRENIQPDRSPR